MDNCIGTEKGKCINKKSLIGYIALIVVAGSILGIGFINHQKQQVVQQKKKMLLSIVYEHYQNSSSKQELRQMIGIFDPSLITGYSAEGKVTEIDMDKFSSLAEEGKILINQKGKSVLNNALNKDFHELINLIKNKKFDDEKVNDIINEIELSNAVGVTNFRDIEVLSAYVNSEKYYKQGDDFMMALYLKDIPDDYNGFLYQEILSRKEELASTSEKYNAFKAIEEMALIKLVDCRWYQSGNYAYFEGKVKNSLSYPISFVKVEVVYKTVDGQIVDTDWTYAVGSHPLQPGYVKSFSLMTPYSEGMHVASYSVVSYMPNK